LGTLYDTITKAETCNGTVLCDGAVDCSGALLVHAPEDISLPLLKPEHQIYYLNTDIGAALDDYARVRLQCDGAWLCDGSNQQSCIDTTAMPLEIKTSRSEQADIADGSNAVTAKRRDMDRYRLLCNGEILCNQGKEVLCDGEYLCDGEVSCARFIPLFNPGADTVRVRETCRGAWRCDGAIDCSGETRYTLEAQSLLDPARELDRIDSDIGAALDDYARVRLQCDGTWLCDGSNQQSCIDSVPTPPRIHNRQSDQTVIQDGAQGIGVGQINQDRYRPLCDGEILCNQGKEILCDGEYRCDGEVSCARFIPLPEQSEYTELNAAALTLEPMSDQGRVKALCDGSILCDGSNQESCIDAPMTLRVVKHYWCDGRREVSCTPCDGSMLCEGTHTCFNNGWYCEGTIMVEEAA
jgi:hypothetical protein